MFKLPFFLIIFTIIHLNITSLLSSRINVQQNLAEGLCVYNYDSDSNQRYTCDLYNAVISSPEEVLIITGNHLPNHADSNVRVVIHRNVSISYFNGEVLRKFTNLEYLAMGDAGVSRISENAFDVCGKLDHIYIGFNSLQTLPSRMLQNCVNLIHFDSYFNSLTSIPEDLFGDITKLEIFELISNQLNSLPRDLLRNMINLKQFIIRSNSITNIDKNLLVNSVNLEKVDLSDNRLSNSSVITELLNGHWTLNSIKISQNQFTSIDFTFFSQFTQLIDFEIGGGDSWQMTGIDWTGLPASLTTIYVWNIGEEIPDDAFNHLPNLRSLGFTGDGITNLHEDTFKSLVNLNSLSIQSTQIRTIPSNIFASQTNLTQLYLSFNNIQELPAGLFASLVNLGLNRTALRNDLALSGNKIRRLNANTFGYHPHLKNIGLASNDIVEIERELFAIFPNPMEIIDLTWNNCTNAFFMYALDIQNDERLENCFNNWAGITTTQAPSGTDKIGAGFSLILITFLLIVF